MFEIREITNETECNPLLISKQTPFTQAEFYGQWQEMMGRRVRRFEIRRETKNIGFFQVIKYPLLFSQSFLYIPHGPVITHNTQYTTHKFLREFYEILIKIGKEENAIFVRFDFYPSLLSGDLTSAGFKKVLPYAYRSSYFQPKFEWLVDLTKTEEEILSGMHPKTRYNIRLAEKKGVETEIVKDNFEKYFGDFYELLEKTAKRDNFGLHPKIYYQNIFKTLDSNSAFLAVARYDNNILLVNLVLLYGGIAYFLFSGSSNKHKNLMFSRLAQWEAIKESKKRGFDIYNFGGVDGGDNYKTYQGISFFKKRFGGELLEYSDSYDLILKPTWYRLYSLRKKFQFR